MQKMSLAETATQTRTGRWFSIGGVIGIATLIAEVIADKVLSPQEIGAVATAVAALFGSLALRASTGK